MIVLGLTGSIGMGKSTTADMFRELDIPVFDSDATVHMLYQNEAVIPVGEKFPEAVVDGRIDRQCLGAYVIGKPENMKALEAIVHPLVAEKRREFLEAARQLKAHMVVLDIPLLFETGSDQFCDKVLTVTAPEAIQRKRVLARNGMSVEKLDGILASQIPDPVKRERSDFVIDTSLGFDHARKRVREIVDSLTVPR